MKITLHNPPEGYEAEAEWRYPVKGEHYIGTTKDAVIETAEDNFSVVLRIVLTPQKPDYIPRPDWLPDRLTYGWLAMEPNGDWYWFETRPHTDEGEWMADGEGMCRGLPPCLIPEGFLHADDWRESLICCTPEKE